MRRRAALLLVLAMSVAMALIPVRAPAATVSPAATGIATPKAAKGADPAPTKEAAKAANDAAKKAVKPGGHAADTPPATAIPAGSAGDIPAQTGPTAAPTAAIPAGSAADIPAQTGPTAAPTAVGFPQATAEITIVTPDAAKVGQQAVIVAYLQDGNSPIAGADLLFAVDGDSRRSATDADGAANLQVRDLHAGPHSVTVSFDGRVGSAHPYEPAVAYAAFDVAPLRLLINTLPSVAGVAFTVSGSTYSETLTTEAGGNVAFDIPEAGIANLSIQLPPGDGHSNVAFSRWSDEAFLPERQIRLYDDVSIDCGLRISYLTSVEFVGLDGRLLDASRVSQVTISGPNAEVIRLQQPYPSVWLTTPLPGRRYGQPGLHITPTPYSVASGLYDGLSVINRGEQRFTPELGGTWKILLLLYELRIRARDAVFGTFYADHTVVVTDPLGNRRKLVLDGNRQVTLTVGRGMYIVHVVAPGISPAAPVALSRSQTTTVPIISPGDIVLLCGLGLVAMILMFVAARRRYLIWRAIFGSARRLRAHPWRAPIVIDRARGRRGPVVVLVKGAAAASPTDALVSNPWGSAESGRSAGPARLAAPQQRALRRGMAPRSSKSPPTVSTTTVTGARSSARPPSRGPPGIPVSSRRTGSRGI